MPAMSSFGALAELPWERITDKIERRVLAGKQGMIVWWKMKARSAIHLVIVSESWIRREPSWVEMNE